MVMQRPWEVDAVRGVVLTEISHPVVAAGEWGAVEAYLGLGLPSDYKELIGDGGGLVFDDELFVYSPFDDRLSATLFAHVANSSWSEAVVRAADPQTHPGPVYPERGGILGWGTDGGGGEYHWDTSDADPEHWTIVVTGRPVDGYERHAVGLAGYLAGLADDTIAAAALADWPGPNPRIRRSTN
jgi:hypothetical protein